MTGSTSCRPTFTHADDGTPETVWSTDRRLLAAPRLELSGAGSVLVLAAHPDDETLGAGGLIASAAAAGLPVHVIIASDGEASHPNSSTHSAHQLAAIRRDEAVAAMSALGAPFTAEFLGLPDGKLNQRQADLEAAVRARCEPRTVVVTPWRGDAHPDHEACALAARAALRLARNAGHWQFPVWAWHWAHPSADDLPWSALRRLDLDAAALARKREGIASYPSQHSPLSDLPGDEQVLTPSMLAHFRRPFEIFVVEPVHPAANPRYFDALYADADDPWGLADRFYETRKRELLLAALPRPRFARAFEPGCATGLITERLARRCDQVVAQDASPRAVELTSARVAALDNVVVAHGAIPHDWPEGRFDLIVLSEIAYYCDDLVALVARVRASLTDDGVLVGCHWRHHAPDHPHTAEQVHDALGVGLHAVVRHDEDDFLLAVWSVADFSVARSTGIVE